jgi:peptide/nickel transport system permease protein
MKVDPSNRIYFLMLIIGVLSWTSLSRLVRGQILTLREQEFMQATEALGLRDRRKIFRHLLPNTIPTIIVTATLGVAGAIITESALSYLGIGVVPPTPSWGNMISAANNLIDFRKRPWIWVPPGMCILITVVAINLIGDGLRDALDPKMKK